LSVICPVWLWMLNSVVSSRLVKFFVRVWSVKVVVVFSGCSMPRLVMSVCIVRVSPGWSVRCVGCIFMFTIFLVVFSVISSVIGIVIWSSVVVRVSVAVYVFGWVSSGIIMRKFSVLLSCAGIMILSVVKMNWAASPLSLIFMAVSSGFGFLSVIIAVVVCPVVSCWYISSVSMITPLIVFVMFSMACWSASMSFLVAPPPPPPPPVVVVVVVVVVVARHALFEQPFVQVLWVQLPALHVCKLLPSQVVSSSSYTIPLCTHWFVFAQ